jgi:hypothetical protein
MIWQLNIFSLQIPRIPFKIILCCVFFLSLIDKIWNQFFENIFTVPVLLNDEGEKYPHFFYTKKQTRDSTGECGPVY